MIMNIQFHHCGIYLNASSRHWLRQTIERLQTAIPISAAAVVLERHQNGAPAFRAFVSLAVPGPDIHAEARDYTLEAAWWKVAAALQKQIKQRKSRQGVRMKTN